MTRRQSDSDNVCSPPPYHPIFSETDPLIGPRKSSRRHQYVIALLTAALVIFGLVALLIPSNNPSDPNVRDRIRKEWDIELRQHEEEVLKRINTQKRWRLEDSDRINLREQWGTEVEEHNREVEARQKRDEEAKNHIREQWEREVEEHDNEVEEGRRHEEQEKIRIHERWRREAEEHGKEVDEARRREEQESVRLREQWRREEEEARRHEEQENSRLREQWEREVDEHKREVEERRRREEQERIQEERLRLNMFWTDPESHTCTSYATREYTARLVNVPSNYNRRVEACMATPVQIHGNEYTPKWCEDHGPNNVIGHWEVDQHEPDCASYWNWYKDFVLSEVDGMQRIEHYLENIPSGGDWKEFCATTPASFRGMHFTGAEFCFQKNYGTYGHWVFADDSCN
ncbi:hypothetical protein DEU56DRAFT_808954 [Suillus clintonianus]|uniref:uncharacterized protein n=1 Tax=Suillus clintonianus TaxID=1904413 RepID=UPI001B86B15B|nr:uncharacterized protein DEU56DRAFT_808954 [Suillus clintonianus]KAG2134836.1 hypothetical protein DEU56DRAFT_808954 [Suillus clintonianus]